MSEIAISARGLSKRYAIGQQERENALRNVLGPILRAPWKLLEREKKETFWALKDVNLEVKHGEVLGLINFFSTSSSSCFFNSASSGLVMR